MINDFLVRFLRHSALALRVSKIAILVFVLLSPVFIQLDTFAQPNQVSSEQDNACRLWGIIGTPGTITDDVKNQLIGGASHDYTDWPCCLKRLGDNGNNGAFSNNPDGWGIGTVGEEGWCNIYQGYNAAWTDGTFDAHVLDPNFYGGYTTIVICHVRYASSGSPTPASGDPHPFCRSQYRLPPPPDGYTHKWWYFEHNGGVDSTAVRNLITGGSNPTQHKAYFDANPDDRPICYHNPPCNFSDLGACIYQNSIPPNHIVDSELYFIYLRKCIELDGGDIPSGVTDAVNNLKSCSTALNFILTQTDSYLPDGYPSISTTMWGFCYPGDDYHTLYYWIAPDRHCGVIASTPPPANQNGWIQLNEGDLIHLWMQSGVVVYQIYTVGAVGGIAIPVDKFGLLAPHIGFASTITIGAVATVVYVKRVKRRKEKR